MHIDIDLNFKENIAIAQKLDAIIAQLTRIEAKENAMAQELDDLTAQVTRSTDVEQSAIILIQGIAARIQAAIDAALAGGATPATLAAITAERNRLLASADALAAAVTANTPAA